MGRQAQEKHTPWKEREVKMTARGRRWVTRSQKAVGANLMLRVVFPLSSVRRREDDSGYKIAVGDQTPDPRMLVLVKQSFSHFSK